MAKVALVVPFQYKLARTATSRSSCRSASLTAFLEPGHMYKVGIHTKSCTPPVRPEPPVVFRALWRAPAPMLEVDDARSAWGLKEPVVSRCVYDTTRVRGPPSFS